jgi:hypothetical protein
VFSREPAHIIRTLLDVLPPLLSLDFVYAWVSCQPEQPAIEAVRFAPGADACNRNENLERMTGR